MPDSKDRFTKPWVLRTCSQGEVCWCRMAHVEGHESDDLDEMVLWTSGSIDTELAEYLVKLHNAQLQQAQQASAIWDAVKKNPPPLEWFNEP